MVLLSLFFLGAAGAAPNLIPYQPVGWSDKIVVSRTAGATSASATDSTGLGSSDNLYVSWAVVNSGTAATAAIYVTSLYVDGVLRVSWNTQSGLLPNYYISINDYSIGSLSAGTHTIKLTADASGVIAETLETDNSYIKTITVALTQPNMIPYQPAGWSDKIVVSRVAGATTDSANLTTTDSLYVDWAVINNGSAATAAAFTTELYVDGGLKTSKTTTSPLNGSTGAALPTAVGAAAAQASAIEGMAYARARTGSLPAELARFRDWTLRYFGAVTSVDRTALEAEGQVLARQRRPALRALIERDPRLALAASVPAAERERLPAAIVAELEARFSAVGDFIVLALDYGPLELNRRKQVGLSIEPFQQSVQLGGVEYRAFVYGRRSGQTTKQGIPLHGILLDGVVALHESAVRVFDADETPLAGRLIISVPAVGATVDTKVAEVGGKIYRFASSAELLLAERKLEIAEMGLGPSQTLKAETVILGASSAGPEAAIGNAAAPSTAWTVGNKKILYIRVDFSDLTGEPKGGSTIYTSAYLQNFADTQVSPYYAQSSYGLTTLTNTVSTSVYRMRLTAAAYATAGSNTQLHTDARAAAAANYTMANYDRIVVVFSWLGAIANSQINYGGLANVGGPNVWVNGEFDFRVVAHELGHTFGLFHANLWQVSDGNPVSAGGTSAEYGDDFDTMGVNDPEDRRVDFNPWFKNLLGWVADSQVQTVASNGTYRVNRFDNSTGTGTLALKIPRDGTRNYWVGVRRNFTTNTSMQNGAYVIWGYNTNQQSNLLDLTTPGTNNQDAALGNGATLSDSIGQLSIRTLALGGTAPNEYVDVQVTTGEAQIYTSLLDYNLGALSAGTHTLRVKTDATGAIAESNESDNEYTKTITVTAQATIVALAGSGGTITPSGSFPKTVGDNQVFTAGTTGSYIVNQWLVDGVVVQSGGGSFTLSNIQGNHTVQVTFKAQPGALQFNATTYAGREGVGNVTIAVTRTGGTDGAVGVGYTTTNGTATAGSDYTAASGSLSWADGETASKSFTVSILEDVLVEGNEIVNLTLSNATGGATLGTPATATLTIADNVPLTATQVISIRALTAGTVAVSFAPVTGAAGSPPYTYAVAPSLPANLLLNTSTGAITGTPSAASAAVNFTITVTDSTGAKASNGFSLTVNVALAANTGTISSRTLTASAVAAPFTPLPLTGGTPPYVWSVSPALASGLALSTSAGAITGTPSSPQAAKAYTITGADSVGAQVTQFLSILVNSALTTTQAVASRTLSAGTAVSLFTPVTAAGGTTPYAFGITPSLPANLVFDPSSGAISGTQAAALSLTTYTVTVTDSVGATSSKTFSLTVNGPLAAAPAIATKALTAGTAAVAFTPVTGAGGTPPYNFAVSPTLPSGLVISSTTGAVSGTPLGLIYDYTTGTISGTAGTAATTYTVTITDSVSANASNTFSLTVNPALATTPAVATKALTVGAAAVAFAPVTAADGTPAYTFAIAPVLPAGLAMSPATGIISGTPSAVSPPTIYAVTVTDSVGAVSGKTFALQVNAPLASTQVVATKALTAGTAAVAFTPVTGTGGTPPYKFAVSPTLPSGLVISPTTGAVSGTASAASAAATYTVTITDSVNASVNSTFSITVNVPLAANTGTVSSRTLSAGTAAVAFTPLPLTGGTLPYVWSVTPALPAALSLSPSTGAISGTPVAAWASANFTITGTDAAGAVVTQPLNLVINAVLTATEAIASRALTATTPAVSFIPVTFSGGTTPYTLAISPALPANLAFSPSTGAITGTPAGAQTAVTFTVAGTDAVGAVASRTFSLTINGPLTAVQAMASKVITATTAAPAFRPVFPGGGTSPYTFAVTPALPAALGLNTSTGNISGTPSATMAATTFTIAITDAAGATASQPFSLVVNGPVAATQAIATKALTTGTPATSFVPVTASGGVPPYSFSASLPAGLTINPTTGAITGTPAAASAASTVTVTATDSVGATATAGFSLTVNVALASAQAVANKVYTVNRTAVAFTPVTITGGTAPLAYAVNPALPAGLALNPTSGAVSGTPTVASPIATYTITVTDSMGAVTSNTFSLTVNPTVVATPVIASRTFTVGTAAATFTPVTASAGTAPYTFAVAPALPGGLTLNATTGTVSGTPTAAAALATYTVTVTDAVGATTSQGFALTINGAVAAPQAIASKVLTAGTPAAFSPVTAAGGTAPYTFTITPALPGGLILNPGTGAISGAPLAAMAVTTFTVTVTDVSAATASSSFSLTVNGAVVATPAIASRALTAGVAAVAFTPVTGADGTPPYAFAVTPSLPVNLTLNATTGVISGTPSAATASASYTVTITDSVGGSASGAFGLTVNAALAANAGTILGRTLTAGAAASAFAPLPLTAGTPPYSWSVAPALPSGLTLNNSTGAISGTPAAALVSANFTITGADSAGAQVTQTLALVVNAALTTTQAVASRSLSAGTAAASFTPVTAAGGTTPYRYAVAPALPAGLAFDSSTAVVSGTPSVALATTVFAVTVTDSTAATSSKTFTLTVNGSLSATQVIPTKSLTAAMAAVAFAPVTGAGGTAPYTYAIAPTLPTGLSFSTSTGSITGSTPAAVAATTFTVTVTDSAATPATATNPFSLTVNPVLATTQAVATKVLSAGAAAVAFSPVTAADGTPPYTYAVSPPLPVALSLSATTGAISGTPGTALAATIFTVAVADSVGATSNKTFSLTVNGAPAAVAGQTITAKALTVGASAGAFTPLPVTGGTGAITYSVIPALPTGLSLDPSTGAIAGTAASAAAASVYAITATDSLGAKTSLALTLVVNPVPAAVATVPNSVLLVNVPGAVFAPVTVTGGTPPYAYAISPALPTGLALSTSTGALSGTPTVASTLATYNVTATDASGATASATFTLKVNVAPAITAQPSANPFYVLGGTLNLSVVASGTPAPTYQWRNAGTAITGNASATTANLTITGLQLTDAGNYEVVVTNEVVSVTSNPATVAVYVAPTLTTQPGNQTITAGGTATFTAAASGTPAPTLQWQRNGVPLSGATAPILTLTGVPLNGGGAITVVATNPGGSATSNAATLTVSPVAPVFAAGLSATATAIQGRNFSFAVAINNTAATFSATGLGGPGGTLVISPDNGSLSGVPANLGTFAIAIAATNTTAAATYNLSLTVQAPPPVITSAAGKNGRVNAPFTFAVLGTNSPTSYAATNLPPGLTINTGSGAIGGTPTAAGTFTVGLTATNASGSVNQPLVITIDPPLNAPVYAGTLSPSGTQGTSFSFSPSFGTVTAPYALTGTLPTGLSFVAATGIISGTPTQVGAFPVTLSATNLGGPTSVNLTVVINPAPTAPVITSASTAPAARVGVAFSFNLTSSGTPAASSYSATGLPAGWSLNATTGAITGTPTAFGSFDVSVSATNTVGTGPTAIFSISVAPSASAPVITSAPVAPGQVGTPFSYAITANNSPTSYQITSGTLPAGLSLNTNTGAITGTPLAAALGETRVWFNATDSVGIGFGPISGLSLEVLFTIAPAASTPVVNSNGTATAQVGQPFQYAITASSSTAITSYGAKGRPAWLALDPATGVLSGIPTEATTSAISMGLTATNSGGASNPKSLLLTVAAAPATPLITSALTARGRVGTAFTYQITASETPTSYVAVGLPPGVSLDSTTGAITGSPTAANSFDVAIRAASAGGLGAPSTLNISVAPAALAPAISSAASVQGQVGVAFTYQIVASNGPILSCGLTGTLPLGLALNTSTGAITGTPADDPRSYTVQLTATNAGGTSLPQPLSINLAPALGVPVLTTPQYVSGTVGVDFAFAITATNLTGSAPYAPPISLDAVYLPGGLAVNPATGVIQGKPTAVGTSVATLTAANAAGTGATRDLTVTIQPAPAAPVIGITGSAVGQVGQAFTYQVSASNAPTSFEVLGAPVWMTVNGATGAITGVPTAPGDVTVQLVASNAIGSSSQVPLAVTIYPAANTPVITSPRTLPGTVGVAFTYTPTTLPAATGFVALGLPGGLSINATTGVISGTPTNSNVLNIPCRVIITPSNGNGVGAPVTLQINILPNGF